MPQRMMRTVLLHYLRAATLDCTRRGAKFAQPGEASPAMLRLCRSESTGSIVTDGATEPEPSVSSRVVVSRLLYRSRQRGFLEMDLLVGLWAERRLPHMAESELAAYSTVLDQENPDLFKWLTGQEPAPDDMLTNPAFKELHEHVQGQLAAHCAPGAASVPGKPWVRGWDDSSQPINKPPQAT